MRKAGDSSVDAFRASKQGIIGGIGTIPGTMGAHAFDAVKIILVHLFLPLKPTLPGPRFG